MKNWEELINKVKETTDRMGLNSILFMKLSLIVYMNNYSIGRIMYDLNGCVRFIVKTPHNVKRFNHISYTHLTNPVFNGYEIVFSQSYINSAELCDLDNNVLDDFSEELTKSVSKFRLLLTEIEKKNINDEKNGKGNKFETQQKDLGLFFV